MGGVANGKREVIWSRNIIIKKILNKEASKILKSNLMKKGNTFDCLF